LAAIAGGRRTFALALGENRSVAPGLRQVVAKGSWLCHGEANTARGG
jgi:hypothetical protein